ncbi:hypothetical protein ES319_D11G056300v1 [Gossypium barbadense]|uniref:non-specific serine/threonine protein kinase n=1 Tax=Gossypium barbadense TaxID=3634 RepID=A0A5J5P769_GOSBA|nr:hypothetical protein ES319_D11G056300v1 [Gossypium barbadense]
MAMEVEETVKGTEGENPEIDSNHQLPRDKGNETEEKSPEIESNQPPRGVLENPELGSDSDNSATPTRTTSKGGGNDSSDPQKPVLQKWADSFQWKSVIGSIKRKSARSISVIPLLTKLSKRHGSYGDEELDCMPLLKASWKNFSYLELANATDNFSPENLLGRGGHALVYKGHLSDGQIVAVKKMVSNGEDEDLAGNFLTELGIIAHINHPNAAHLIGFSVDYGLHLVLEFSPFGSLTSMLFYSKQCLDWKTRFKVAVGISEGLKYLHHDCHRRIIHRDITASNILLTEDYEAQISDFGLAKWLPDKWAHHIVHPIEGTFGYLAPEYFMHGIVDEKTDVFAFGVLLLEIVTGRRAVDKSKQSLARPFLESNQVKELVDPRLKDDYNPSELQRTLLTASMCLSHLPTNRPTMTKVVKMLKNEDGPIEFHQISCGRKAVIFDGYDLKDSSCKNYLHTMRPT